MKKQQLSGSETRKKSDNNEEILEAGENHVHIELTIDKWRKEVCSLSYDQALKALDLLLEELQNDNVPVENLQRHYIQGQIYLNHCENLLKNVEQEVIELPPETLQ